MQKVRLISFLFVIVGLYIFASWWLSSNLGLMFRIDELLLGVLNIIVFFFLTNYLFKDNLKLQNISLIVFSLNPWLWYVTVFNVPYLFLLLIFQILLWSFFAKKYYFSLGITLVLSFLFFRFGFLNFSQNDAGIFSDPGLINNINQFRGESVADGYSLISKLSENRYWITFEFLITKYLKNFTPSTLFTFQGLMAGFSFSPPILLGFMPFLLYGIWKAKREDIPLFLTYLMVVLPSFLSKKTVDLDRLILVLPLLTIFITKGIFFWWMNKKKANKILFIFFFLIICFQQLFVIYDIGQKEGRRYHQFQNEK